MGFAKLLWQLGKPWTFTILLTVLVAPFAKAGIFWEEGAMHLYMHMYMPLLLTSCIVTVGYVVAWALNGGGIDPGPPNARM